MNKNQPGRPQQSEKNMDIINKFPISGYIFEQKSGVLSKLNRKKRIFTVVENHIGRQPFFFDRKPFETNEGRGMFNLFLEIGL